MSITNGLVALALGASLVGIGCQKEAPKHMQYNLGTAPTENPPITDLPYGIEGRIHIIDYDDGNRMLSLNLKINSSISDWNLKATNIKKEDGAYALCPVLSDFVLEQRQSCLLRPDGKPMRLYWNIENRPYYEDGRKAPVVILYMDERK